MSIYSTDSNKLYFFDVTGEEVQQFLSNHRKLVILCRFLLFLISLHY